MKKIVVFGATGNIGAYFTDYCRQHMDLKEYEIIAVGRKKTDFFKTLGITYIMLDLCNSEDFEKLPTKDVYAVVNLAGLLPAYLKEYDPFSYVETNIKGTLRILEYARRNHVDRILYTQTWADQAGYWNESEVLSPDMPRKLVYKGDHAFYAITKSMVVDMMEYYKQEYGLKNFVFRLPTIYSYGPQSYYYENGEKKLIAFRYMIEQAIKGEDIEMWGNPNAFKDVVYVKDLCQMMYKALYVNIGGGTYNVGTGNKISFRDIVEGVVEVFASDKKSRIIHMPEKPSITSFVMDIENAKRDLGYEPEYTYIKYLEDYKVERELKRFDKLWGY